MLKCLAVHAVEGALTIVGKVKVQFQEHLEGHARGKKRIPRPPPHSFPKSWRHSGAWHFSAWPSSSILSIWSPSSMSTSSAQSSLACALSRSTLLRRLPNDWFSMSVCAISQAEHSFNRSHSNKNIQEMASAPTKPSNTSPTLHPPPQTIPSPWSLAHWHPSSDLES